MSLSPGNSTPSLAGSQPLASETLGSEAFSGRFSPQLLGDPDTEHLCFQVRREFRGREFRDSRQIPKVKRYQETKSW